MLEWGEESAKGEEAAEREDVAGGAGLPDDGRAWRAGTPQRGEPGREPTVF